MVDLSDILFGTVFGTCSAQLRCRLNLRRSRSRSVPLLVAIVPDISIPPPSSFSSSVARRYHCNTNGNGIHLETLLPSRRPREPRIFGQLFNCGYADRIGKLNLDRVDGRGQAPGVETGEGSTDGRRVERKSKFKSFKRPLLPRPGEARALKRRVLWGTALGSPATNAVRVGGASRRLGSLTRSRL